MTDETDQRKPELESTSATKTGASVSPAMATILAALTALIGTGVGAYLQGKANLRVEQQRSDVQLALEQKKFESQLILKAVETGDEAASARNLLFLIRAGIADPKGTIEKLASDAGAVPVLPTVSSMPSLGVGGDPQLNTLKNREMAPAAYRSTTFDEIITNQPPSVLAMGRKPRELWTQQALRDIEQQENKGVTIEGYIQAAKISGPTSSNAQSRVDRDIRLHLVEAADDAESQSIVAVISPRIFAKHPKWTLNELRRLVASRQKVRLSGWLLWNQLHLEQIGHYRATLWELHPVLRIEVFSENKWQEF